jgi:hypothetical protein
MPKLDRQALIPTTGSEAPMFFDTLPSAHIDTAKGQRTGRSGDPTLAALR